MCERKTREDDHPGRLSEPLEVAKLSLDYCFFGRALEAEKDPTTVEELKQPKDEQEGAVPALVVYDHKSGATFSGMVNKGVDPYGLAIVTEALKICGRQKVRSCRTARDRSRRWPKLRPRVGERKLRFRPQLKDPISPTGLLNERS